MKQFLFKHAALLGKGKAGHKNSIGRIYPVGVHSVPDDHQKDPTFLHFAKHGLIEPFTPKAQGKLKPAESHAAKQSAEVAAKSQLEPDAEASGDHDMPPDGEGDIEPVVDFGDDADEKPKHHGKSRRK